MRKNKKNVIVKESQFINDTINTTATINKYENIRQFAMGVNSILPNETPPKFKIKQHLREPVAMDVDNKLHKVSEIYDKYTPHSDRYTIDDSPYNPYSANINSIPSSNYFNNLNSLIINNFFLGYGELSLIAQNPIISNICQIFSDEIIGKWIRFYSKDDKDKSDKIKQAEKWFTDKKIKEHFKIAIKKAFLFGGSQVYIKIKNDDKYTSGKYIREEPIKINDHFDNMLIDKGDVEYLQVIEPIWSTGINWQSFNPLLPDFYKPQKYAIMGRITHVTRLMHFKYKEVPDILKPTYMFQGQPLAQELIPYLMGFEQSRININKLIAKYNHFVLKCNLESIIADNSDAFVNGQNLGVRIDLFNQVATNGNVIAIDKDSEEFENISVNLSGLSEIMNQNIQYVCSIGRIPVNKLFQNSLGGLNPTGEFETTSFRDTIREHRVNIVDHNIQQALELFMIDVYGEIDDDICWEWLPIEESNELEQSQINLNIANELSTLTNAGILAQQQAAQVLVQTEDVKYSGLEIVEENYQNEIDNLDNENEE